MAAHNSNRLSALFIKKITEPGKYGDGYGLYLVVAKSGAKRWEQRITNNGKRHDLGLGSASLISLEEVREIAIRNKRMIKNGGNPLKEKRAQQAKDKSLKEIALIVHKMNAKTYKNEKLVINFFIYGTTLILFLSYIKFLNRFYITRRSI